MKWQPFSPIPSPDQQLLDAASRDELRDEADVIAHAQHLAASAESVMGDFVGSWLGTADFANSAKDSDEWPGFDALAPHIQHEINRVFAEVMMNPSEQFDSLYAGDVTYLNELLASHFGIGGIRGTGLQ